MHDCSPSSLSTFLHLLNLLLILPILSTPSFLPASLLPVTPCIRLSFCCNFTNSITPTFFFIFCHFQCYPWSFPQILLSCNNSILPSTPPWISFLPQQTIPPLSPTVANPMRYSSGTESINIATDNRGNCAHYNSMAHLYRTRLDVATLSTILQKLLSMIAPSMYLKVCLKLHSQLLHNQCRATVWNWLSMAPKCWPCHPW